MTFTPNLNNNLRLGHSDKRSPAKSLLEWKHFLGQRKMKTFTTG